MMQSMGFEDSQHLEKEKEKTTYVYVYVDDFILARSDVASFKNLENQDQGLFYVYEDGLKEKESNDGEWAHSKA